MSWISCNCQSLLKAMANPLNCLDVITVTITAQTSEQCITKRANQASLGHWACNEDIMGSTP